MRVHCFFVTFSFFIYYFSVAVVLSIRFLSHRGPVSSLRGCKISYSSPSIWEVWSCTSSVPVAIEHRRPGVPPHSMPLTGRHFDVKSVPSSEFRCFYSSVSVLLQKDHCVIRSKDGNHSVNLLRRVSYNVSSPPIIYLPLFPPNALMHHIPFYSVQQISPFPGRNIPFLSQPTYHLTSGSRAVTMYRETVTAHVIMK